MKSLFKIIGKIIEVIIIVYVIAITSLILCRNKFGYTAYGDKTLIMATKNNSSSLNAKINDLLIVRDKGIANTNRGDKIYYYATLDDSYVVRYGTIKDVSRDDEKAIYVLDDKTKTSVPSNRVIGEIDTTYENLGGILHFLVSRVGFLLCVLLPILLIFIYQIYDLVVALKYEEVDEGASKKEKKPEIEVL